MLGSERCYWQQGKQRVAGVDEAGRGPLAGPVVAAAVIIDPTLAEQEECERFAGLTDSKKLTAASRVRFYDLLLQLPGIEVGIGQSDNAEIDEINILQATYRAMARAIEALEALPDIAIVDGNPVQGLPCESEAIIKGDASSLSIAAASVVAKVVRDRCMQEYDEQYPGYGFATHKGYGTSAHIQALYEHGPSPIHRSSFRPVREAAENRVAPPAAGELFDHPSR
jgi:ribonuclease HII